MNQLVHRFTFRNYGGIFQVQLESEADLASIEHLDRARWAATGAPCEQLFADPAVLAYLDSDANGRILVNELIEARRWLWQRLARRDRVISQSDELRLDDLDDEHEEAVKIRALATQLLGQLDGATRDRISLAQVRQFRSSYTKSFPNGDGIVTHAQAKDAATQALLAAVLASTGGAPDGSGEPGVRAEDVDKYVERAARFAAWSKDAVAGPLGDATAEAAALVEELGPKVSQFFAQCALVAHETGAAARLQATPEELAKVDVTSTDAIDAWLDRAPLAQPSREAVLPLEDGVNPRFAARLQKLAREVAPKVLGKKSVKTLGQSEWTTLRGAFEPYLAWKAKRPEGIAADADPAKVAELVAEPVVAALRARIAEDADVADELAQFNNLEKLVLYQRWLLELANNFVTFRDLFDSDRETLFEMGSLVIDGRRLTLCVKVNDRAAHRKLAEHSLIFLLYVEVTRKDAAGVVHKNLLCAGVTAGERGGLDIGKRGVFYDRDGKEWDAIVVDTVVNSISVLEAAFAPFRRIRQAVAERVEKFAASRAEGVEKSASESALAATDKKLQVTEAVPQVAVGAAAKPAPVPPGAPAAAPPPPAPGGAGGLQTLLIGGGVVFAALGSTLAFIFKTLADIPVTRTLGTVVGLGAGLLMLFGFLGWLKLRRRDISALLEACGWALNGRMKLTRELSRVFTVRPPLPEGSRKRRFGKNPAWTIAAAVIVALLLAAGWYVAKHPQIVHDVRAWFERGAAAK